MQHSSSETTVTSCLKRNIHANHISHSCVDRFSYQRRRLFLQIPDDMDIGREALPFAHLVHLPSPPGVEALSGNTLCRASSFKVYSGRAEARALLNAFNESAALLMLRTSFSRDGSHKMHYSIGLTLKQIK